MTNGVLVLLCLIAVALRFVGLNWDSGFHLHPDERFLCIVTPQLDWPRAWTEYFNSSHAPLNPFNGATDFFVYGQLPVVLVKAIAAIFGCDDYQNILLAGRFVSACFDSAVMPLVFLIGRRAGSTRLGLLAAALFGFTTLNIQHAHFFVVDPFAAFFIVASFYFALRATQETQFRARNWLLCGASFGAAMACKFSSILFSVVIAIFLLHQLWRNDLPRNRAYLWRNPLTVSLSALLAFRIFHPLAFRGEGGFPTLWGLFDLQPNPQFMNALAQQQKITSGQIDVPFNLQWFDRTPFLWPLQNLGGWALGWPLLLCTIFGMALVVSRVLRRRAAPAPVVIAAMWCAFAFVFYGAQFSKFTRYYLVVTPFAALLAAWFLLELESRAHPKVSKMAMATFASGVLGATMLWAFAVTSIYTREHPRVTASRWIRDNIPAGTFIANETAWDETLPLGNTGLWPARDLDLFAPDDETKRRNMLQSLDNAEWIFISSPRVLKTIPRLPSRFPLTAEYYRALLDERLRFRREQEFVSYPRLGPFTWRDDHVEEALHVYDHPRVLLFRKTPEYSRRNAAAILNRTQ